MSFYWEHRTAGIEIIDPIGRGGDRITFNVTSLWKLKTRQAELRFFYRGINTVAEYHNNGVMTETDDLHYTRSVRTNAKERRPLEVGDRLEFELSQFLDGPPNGRENYYGTAILYVVGRGIVPWEARGDREDSYPIPESAWLGGRTTLHRQYSGEPDNLFMQMATNVSDRNGQPFVLGRRVHHSDFGDGDHNESSSNPDFEEIAGTLGPNYVNRSCIACHENNGRASPPDRGEGLDRFVVRVGQSDGSAHPRLGRVLQSRATSDEPESRVTLDRWIEEDGLRRPQFRFHGTEPESFSARTAPQLVGMGLLEAIPELQLEALADPDDLDGDGISGRLRIVRDPESGDLRVGRFGWKAGEATVRQQVAAALNTDIGVMNSVYPDPDCGSEQGDCGASGNEIAEEHLEHLTKYIALLGVHARRDLGDPVAARGESLFGDLGCASCHQPSFRTSEYHPLAELRGQTVQPYTDLLLHDMGPGLADTLSEGDEATSRVSGSEWRTAPLWSIGLTRKVSGEESYLHDGRARTLREAILWHGGEGLPSKNAFEKLSAADQNAVIAFLESL
ncbi:MAG: di-heme oxidoredictase family protein [Planctomycetota bacterium]